MLEGACLVQTDPLDFLPKLSEYDPVDTSEGSIDPLGLYPVASALGNRLSPGVRERQSRVRFLTASAVSLHICSCFGDEVVAVDGVSDPSQVFEWHIVEGLVRGRGEDALIGVPGHDKVRAAVQAGRPVSATTYLKAGAAFGFHGVYRILARELGIETAGLLGEAGYRLLRTWEREQGLGPPTSGASPNSTGWSTIWRDAMRDALGAGGVSRKAGWAGWRFVADHLHPSRIGRRESGLLGDLLLGPSAGYRETLIRSLIEPRSQAIWVATRSERELHSLFIEHADAGFGELLETIQTYETFARLLQNAFEDVLYAMSTSRRRAGAADLADEPGAHAAATGIPPLFSTLVNRLEIVDQHVRFSDVFGRFAEPMGTGDFVDHLLLHHGAVQRSKPPHGKGPWCERFDDGTYLIRPAYRRTEGALLDDRYVHTYRSGTLTTFVHDLGLVS